MKNEDGVSELIDETLLIALVVICAGIAGVVFLGFIIPVQKTAYLVPQFGLKDTSGTNVITIYDRGGDPLYFDENHAAKYRGAVFIDTAIGSFRALREPTLTVIQPGDTVYVYYDGSDFVITDDLTGSPVTSLPAGGLAIRIVDTTSNVLIAGETLVPGPVLTATVTTAATTATTTATPTPTPSTAITTATPPASYTVMVTWLPKGTGANAMGTVTPPGTNDGTVNIVTGGSQTFTAIPAAGDRVRFIFLDGIQVSPGGSVNQTVTYMLTNVQANHNLSVHFAAK